ncbi:hypothetical protein DQ04_04431030 [Trypanosoma grayi]|uniref:hypothetical protein n=1 Tax=Trypanosoma grayi TaxID=71804 RepID=UPI0004F4BA95|nr:hypothetical protein DQ04_04431030 [Trypanosoma grayi]KEG09925.1 hypothetical protein DQ04_04431030 [Trypanosoma grayi]
MAHLGSGGLAGAHFVITRPRTGEVLVEVTPLPSSSSTPAPASAEVKSCGLFSDAFDFVGEAQARSYEFFGRNMANGAGATCATGADGARSRRKQNVDAMVACDAPSSTFMDSAEWEGGDAESDGSDEAGESDGDGEAVGMSDAPPAKRLHN